MNSEPPIDFDLVLRKMIQHSSIGHSIHGPDHWARVEQNGIRIANRNGADLSVVRLFALIHDAERRNDGHDPQHGQRAAELAANLNGDLFSIDQISFELLYVACELHHQGGTTDDITIGTCWDADRLDLPRVGITPETQYMSTAEGKVLAEFGDFDDESQG